MTKPLEPSGLIDQFRILLLSRSPLTAIEACRALGISQASLSRLVSRMDQSLIKIGQARNTRYVLKKQGSPGGDRLPLYQVTQDGRASLLAHLYVLEPKGFYLESESTEISNLLFSDLPYFLDDLRPSGFLGRLIPKAYPQLESSPNILNWSVADCLHYWTQYAWNLPGNLILGETALRIFLEKQQSELLNSDIGKREHRFCELAKNILLQGQAGSSAGGEQPKFLLEATRSRPAALVKFSPPHQNEISHRIADLLICEHIAHEVLSKNSFESAKSRILLEENQLFLEVDRFDRVGLFGRKGVISLRALSLEFVGTLDSWSAIASGLLRAKLISKEDHSKIRLLEMFGELIGNSDMHAGNLSFFMDEKIKIADLAPVYDMLPMAYYPRQNQVFPIRYLPKFPLPEDAAPWKIACKMALQFWNSASLNPQISEPFRVIAAENHGILDQIFKLS